VRGAPKSKFSFLANYPLCYQDSLMRRFQLFSSAEQVATHLRAELASGRLRGLMPGVLSLEAEMGINRKAIDAALKQLEREGLLMPQGVGKRRKIVPPEETVGAAPLQVAILLNEAVDRRLDYMVELQHALVEAGHAVVFAPKVMVDLGMDLKRIAKMVEQTEADAWMVMAGSREVLSWFSAQVKPAFALFGRRGGLPIAAVGPDKRPPYLAATRALASLGHRRIVLLVRPRRRLPEPGAFEKAFLDELAAHGLPVSDYNLPGWEETIEGFQERLNSLFHLTPPTALIIDEGPLFTAAMQFLAQRKIRAPQDVSLICTDSDPTFEWCQPSISHIRWDSRPVVRRIVRWVANVSCGKTDIRQTLTPAEFVSGGTIGPAPG
jgi:DNA-binding LacI/PurR family transcriptional regulator